LRTTLVSVLGQDYHDLEVIVVDDASRPPADIVAAGFDDQRLRVVRNTTPQGVSAARNRGIAEAAGEWVAFLDDDDVWAPDKLSRQLQAARDADAAWAYAGDVIVDRNLRILFGGPPPSPADVMAWLSRFNPVTSGGSNVLVRADVLAQVGGFDPRLRRTEDWDLWLRLGRHGPPAWVRAPLVAYRFHPANVAADVSGMVEEALRLRRRHRIPVDLAAMHRRAAWTALRNGRRLLAAYHYLRAVLRGDVRSIARMGVAVVHPAVGTDRLFGLLPSSPESQAWAEAAQGWLRQLARGDTPPDEPA
ncbi:MAG: glycosyltransferase, partial [Nitriliruptorales bacterium]|nr:glycosyltransferase [Nitriliruptorales bacterium]